MASSIASSSSASKCDFTPGTCPLLPTCDFLDFLIMARRFRNSCTPVGGSSSRIADRSGGSSGEHARSDVRDRRSTAAAHEALAQLLLPREALRRRHRTHHQQRGNDVAQHTNKLGCMQKVSNIGEFFKAARAAPRAVIRFKRDEFCTFKINKLPPPRPGTEAFEFEITWRFGGMPIGVLVSQV